ncbi:hypothetical protein AB1288_18190 [Pseudomonas putida]|uniref:hypothetical protein n=1 Tax=Pseudomonas putida TaxID=303 RepID=UPI00345D327B
MDFNEQRTPVDEPVADLHLETLSNILRELKQAHIPEDGSAQDAKLLVNNAFEIAQAKLHLSLKKGNSDSWVLEAYKQIFMWTGVYRGLPFQKFISPVELAPVGRFGWRFVIEHILSGGPGDSLQRRQPSLEDVTKVFTILSVMTMAAEWSNLIHFFPDVYGDVEFDLSSPVGILAPILSDKSKAVVAARSEYMRRIDHVYWETLNSERKVEDEGVLNDKFSSALLAAKGFTSEQVEAVIDILLHKVLSSGIVLIIPGEYFVDWVSDESNLPKSTVYKILNFMLLSSASFKTQGGNFLDKKDPVRMINFAGVRLERVKFLSSIYPKSSVSMSHIKKASWHAIINIFMVGEWSDIFKHRTSIGQRPDLKVDPLFNRALEDIEQYHRRTIFENIVLGIFKAGGCKGTKGLKKWPDSSGVSKVLPCGEIDILAYESHTRTLFVVECKASAPATDSRGQFQQHKDHFSQKKYHAKFLLKIQWVEKKLSELSNCKELCIDVADIPQIKLVPLMITRYPSIVKFYVDEYRVLTYAELYEEICNAKIK